MFKISHEVPRELLNTSRKFNDYDYALVHMFEKHNDYYKFFEESLQKGRTVILDNSAYELGEPMNTPNYSEWIEKLQPTEFVVPDFRDDYQKTILYAKYWEHTFDHLTKIGVVHGETYEDYCRCYLELLPLVDKISFSVESFFEKYQTEGMTMADTRVSILKRMLDESIIDTKRRHHILGCLHPTEYKNYIQYDWIESVDTSNPIIYGMFEGPYPEDLSKYKKSKELLADHYTDELDFFQKINIFYNVDFFRRQLEKNIQPESLELDPLNQADEDFKEIADSLVDLLKHKNRNYGNAATDPIRVFTGKCNVGNRLDDKLSRVKASEELRKNDIVDLLGYLVLACREKGWKSFDEFKD